MSDNSSALSDIKILDFSHLLAGPFATQTLGDYGAEVYKIERIHVGDDFSAIADTAGKIQDFVTIAVAPARTQGNVFGGS